MTKKSNRHVLIEHLDNKMAEMSSLPQPPTQGWIHTLRLALNMSHSQFGSRLGLTAQQVRSMEKQEQEANITLQKLQSIGAAFNMRLVYGFVQNEGSLHHIIDKQANLVAEKLARKIMRNASQDEIQEIKETLENVTEELAKKIKEEIPRKLWNQHKS